MELYMKSTEHRRMILESVEHGALIWPTIEENGATGTKKYEELYATEKLQADCDLKATNIILQGLPTDVYSLVNLHRKGDCSTRLGERKFICCWDKVLLVEAQGSGKVLNEEELGFLADPKVAECPVTQTVLSHNAAYQADDLNAYDSECDDFSTTKA
nr:hypothetical protein [Tanacetum cinerariifolium]